MPVPPLGTPINGLTPALPSSVAPRGIVPAEGDGPGADSEPAPLDTAGLRPPGSISVAPSPVPAPGPVVPAAALGPIAPGIPKGDADGIAAPEGMLCAAAVAQLNKSTAAIADNRRMERASCFSSPYERSERRGEPEPRQAAAKLRAAGAMNSGPTGSVTLAARMRSISALAGASSNQPPTSSTGCSWAGWRAPHKAVVTP
jgi:hypothetical protein